MSGRCWKWTDRRGLDREYVRDMFFNGRVDVVITSKARIFTKHGICHLEIKENKTEIPRSGMKSKIE